MNRRGFLGVSLGAAARLALGELAGSRGHDAEEGVRVAADRAVSSVDLTRACSGADR